MSSNEAPPPEPKPLKPCQNCGKPCSTHCSQCKILDFCSRDCQKDLWKVHKTFCKAIAHPTLALVDESSAHKCLIMDGLGPIGPGKGYMKGAKASLLRHGVDVAVVDAADKGKDWFCRHIGLLLQNNPSFNPTAILVLGWGSGNIPEEWNHDKGFQEALQSWCRQGGNLLVQGERMRMCDNWPKWFDKSWQDGDYLRTDHKCNTTTHWCQWFREIYASKLPNYNVKACMITNVPAEEILYGTTDDSASYSLVPGMSGVPIGPGSVAIACGKYEQGTVSFFGDVNYEDPTLEVMAILARGF